MASSSDDDGALEYHGGPMAMAGDDEFMDSTAPHTPSERLLAERKKRSGNSSNMTRHRQTLDEINDLVTEL